MRKLNSVLLIDDDPATNFINKMLIKKGGITDHIETVLNGKQALDYLTNSGNYEKTDDIFPKPELILLDINMPVMDGWEFADAFEKISKNQTENCIIIMLSSSQNPDDKERALKHPAISDYQNKPFSSERLISLINTFFKE